MVHEDKRFAKVERVDTMVLLVVQDNIVIPHLILSSQKKFIDVMECKSSFFFMLPKLIIIMRQLLHTGVLILIHFKTRGQVFSNQRSMMQGTNILCFNLQLILFLNLVISIDGF